MSKTKRVRRPRGITEQLLTIVHWIEILSLAFAALAMWGLTRDWPAPVTILIVIALLIASLRVLRYPRGWVVSLAVQAAVVALGYWDFLLIIMGVVFVALWIFCFVKARQIELRRAS
ncbi:MAG TPA: DUF4233 domain-containing protein [Candidatus Agrococcus pullicola]|uniref:DUF4233 domain-containing protein n=1 Tax=Candidatus Agrococcus pullicola TaxID=2838429 RepID=A0A9D1YUE2_9MICO|nr:DUF4233 domain-containing protein [Candidatus Agrococcus pullicola]